MYSMPPVASKCLLNGPVGNGRGNPSAGDHGPGHTGTQGLMQLIVVVEKDEIGYGLTVSGDKPVHVQSVKENGASARAGVRTGDRIYKVNGSTVAHCDHTEVVSLIKAGSNVQLTLLRKPEKDHSRGPKSTATSPSTMSSRSGGSERITNPRPADAHQEQLVAQEKLDTVRRMYEGALATEKKLQQEYSKTKSHKTEAKLQDARKTTNVIRQQLDALASSSSAEMRPSRNSVCLGDFHSTSIDNVPQPTGGPIHQRPLKASWSIATPFSSRDLPSPRKKSLRVRNMSVKRSNSDSVKKSSLFSHQAVSLPTSVDATDSSVLRSPIHSTIGESTSPYPSATSDDTDDEASVRRSLVLEHRDSVTSSRGGDIFSMEEEDFSPESQTVVKDHGPFMDFELLRHKHAHCSVFLSFLISNADPAPMLFTITTELYTSGSLKDMRRWAYEIHSTFIVRDAPLDLKLDPSVVDALECTLKQPPEKEEQWRFIFQQARQAALEDIRTGLADFRQKRELGLGNFFGDGELKDATDRTSELRIIEKNLKPHYEKFVSDTDSTRSQALSISLATVMKEWGVHKGGIDRQISFVMKDISKTSFKSVLGGKFKSRQKEAKDHVFNPQMYYHTTTCDHCNGLIWGIGFQGYSCSNCEMNIHKECITNVGTCKNKKKKKKSSIIPKPTSKSSLPSTASSLGVPTNTTPNPRRSQSFGSSSMLDDIKDVPSATNEEDLPTHSVAALKDRFESAAVTTNGEPIKTNIGRSGSFKKPEPSKKDQRRAKSDVDKDEGAKILIAMNSSTRTSSSASSLSNRSDSSSSERVNDLSMKQASIDEEGDSDLDVEESMPSLDSVIRKELIRKMKPKDKKLQEVINELLYTERSHVRNLKLLDLLFYRPMSRADFCSRELVDLVFPDIKSLINIHVQLNNEMKAKMKEDPLVSVKDVAHILLSRFDGEAGEKMKEVCALFCRNHTYALSALRERQKRNAKLMDLFTTAEANPMCRRLQFKDLLISEVHRLTKYPLLIDSMCNHMSQGEEARALGRASKCSRAILAHVNHAVKDCENHHKLVALQKRLDTKPIQNSANPLVADYKNLNLQDYKLVYEGALTWQLTANRTKQIDLHVVLLEGILVLLQVQDDNRLVLKCQSQIATQAKDDSKFGHSPIITLNSMLVRQVATDKKAIFIINTSQLGPQIYNLVANSVEEKKRWFKYISEAAESQKKSSNTIRRTPVNKSNLTLTEVSTDESAADEKLSVAGAEQPNVTTNNNVAAESWSGSSPPSYNELSKLELAHPSDASLKDGGDEGEVDIAEVSATCESLPQDDEGERDAKSLVLASLSDTALLRQILSSATNATAASALNAASPSPQLSSPSASTSKLQELSAEQPLSVLNCLNRRLTALLEVMEERDNETARLQHQLQTAEQLLRDTPKDLADSRPNSFVSNSSSSASVGETAELQLSATSPVPVMPAVIEPPHSALNTSLSVDSMSSSPDSDSDNEGTVNADKQELADETKQNVARPDSAMSDVSNTHTDNTLVSTDNLSDDTTEPAPVIDVSSSDVIPHIEVNSASPPSTPSDIESTNIDDIGDAPSPDCSTEPATEAELTAAASIVKDAIKAAVDIIIAESEDNFQTSNGEQTPVDCDNIDVSFECEGDVNDSGAIVGEDIDDSDEADALSASSLD